MPFAVDLKGRGIALVDDADAELVSSLKWYLHNLGYAQTNIKTDGKWRHVYLHRFLLQPSKGEQVDHINGDGLDNRRANLRVCTPSLNSANRTRKPLASSPYRGVRWKASAKRWVAQINVERQTLHVGYFDDAISAAQAYDAAAINHFGPFAKTNF